MKKKYLSAIAAVTLLSTAASPDIQAVEGRGGEFALAAQQTAACTGTVLDTEGEPLVGATVKVDGTDKATTTDVDGKFSISGVPAGSKITVTYLQ